MKSLSSRFLLVLALITGISTLSHAQVADSLLIRCAEAERDAFRLLKKPALINERMKSEEAIRQYIQQNHSNLRTSADDIVTIPVVVHVVHNKEDGTIGGAGNSNISDEQVRSQIDVLNEDYSNKSGYKGFYTDSLAVDTGIRFKLVTIVRDYDATAQFSPITDATKLTNTSPAWVTNRYLNIWVCRLTDRYLGTSQFPVVTEINDRTNGLATAEDEEDALTDGVIIDYRYFGRDAEVITTKIYNLGRTTTHEVGHWLGLIHIWGDRTCGTDYCNDTPTANTKNETTDTSCTPVFSDCRGVRSRNMIENYMDYSPDLCMSIFTGDQKERMHAVLALSPRRAKLVEFSKITTDDLLVEVYPNPVSETLFSNVFTPNFELFTVSVYNVRGQKVTEDAVNRTSLDVKTFPSGLYYYKVVSGNQSLTKRFLVK